MEDQFYKSVLSCSAEVENSCGVTSCLMRAGGSTAGPDESTRRTKAGLVTVVGQQLKKALAPLCVCLCICSLQVGVFNSLQTGLEFPHVTALWYSDHCPDSPIFISKIYSHPNLDVNCLPFRHATCIYFALPRGQ